MGITLKPAHFKNRSVVITPAWVSNGHWAIRKDSIDNAAMFENEAIAKVYLGCQENDVSTNTDELIRQAGPSEFYPFHATPIVIDVPGKKAVQARVFRSESAYTLVDVKYLAIFGLNSKATTLYGAESRLSALTPRKDTDYNICIMPIRIHESIAALLAPIVAVSAGLVPA